MTPTEPMETEAAQDGMNWDLGNALLLLRTVAGMTQEQLAQASGVRGSSLSDYELSKIVPSLKTLRKILNGEGYPFAALEQALTFIETLRSERSLDPVSEPASVSASPQVSRLFIDSAVFRREVEEVAGTAASLVSRLVRLHFAMGFRATCSASTLASEAEEA